MCAKLQFCYFVDIKVDFFCKSGFPSTSFPIRKWKSEKNKAWELTWSEAYYCVRSRCVTSSPSYYSTMMSNIKQKRYFSSSNASGVVTYMSRHCMNKIWEREERSRKITLMESAVDSGCKITVICECWNSFMYLLNCFYAYLKGT